MRIYDPRLGRFLSVDPLTKSYPWYTPYQFAGNKPIIAIDLDGAEDVEINVVAKHLYDPQLQNQAQAVANTDKQALVAMQRTAWNQVLSDLDAIVTKHFDPKHNAALTSTQWAGITNDVSNYSSSSSLRVWNSYQNYDYDYATYDEIYAIIDGAVDGLIQNHFYASSAGTEFYYRSINSVNQAKDPNQKAALIAEREIVSKERWVTIMRAASLGFAELFLAATGIAGGSAGTIGGRTFKTGYYASEDTYILVKLANGEHGGYAPIYRGVINKDII